VYVKAATRLISASYHVAEAQCPSFDIWEKRFAIRLSKNCYRFANSERLWQLEMINVRHLTLHKVQFTQIVCPYKVLKCSKIPQKTFAENRISRILCLGATPTPIRNKPVFLNLKQIGLLVVDEPDAWPRVFLTDSEPYRLTNLHGAEALKCWFDRRMLLSFWESLSKPIPEESNVRNG
jgi:hypothetical protein